MAKAKVDFFKADKALKARVVEFMNAKVWGIVLRKRAAAEREQFVTAIAAQMKLSGSIFDDDSRKTIANYQAKIDEIDKKLAEQLKKEAAFDYTDADRELYKQYKAAQTDREVWGGMCTWFSTYNLKVTDDKGGMTAQLADLFEVVGGGRNLGQGAVIRANAEQFTDDKRTRNDFLRLFYGRLSEQMMQAGVLNPVEIPEDVREMFAVKKQGKKNA